MARLKMHGGYTRDRTTKRVVYWTCGHDIYVNESETPPLECSTCGAMSDTALEGFIKTKKLIIADIPVEY